METIHFLIIGIALIAFIVLWLAIGFKHLKNLQKEIVQYWEDLDELLRKRQDIVPNLIETVRQYIQNHESEIENLITLRMLSAKQYFPGAEKIMHEHELSAAINQLFAWRKENPELGRDTNFLEVKKEIEELGDKIEIRTRDYNEKVRYYNESLDKFYLKLIKLLFGFKRADIFEFEK